MLRIFLDFNFFKGSLVTNEKSKVLNVFSYLMQTIKKIILLLNKICANFFACSNRVGLIKRLDPNLFSSYFLLGLFIRVATRVAYYCRKRVNGFTVASF